MQAIRENRGWTWLWTEEELFHKWHLRLLNHLLIDGFLFMLIYTTRKVDGATSMHCFIMAPYKSPPFGSCAICFHYVMKNRKQRGISEKGIAFDIWHPEPPGVSWRGFQLLLSTAARFSSRQERYEESIYPPWLNPKKRMVGIQAGFLEFRPIFSGKLAASSRGGIVSSEFFYPKIEVRPSGEDFWFKNAFFFFFCGVVN